MSLHVLLSRRFPGDGSGALYGERLALDGVGQLGTLKLNDL